MISWDAATAYCSDSGSIIGNISQDSTIAGLRSMIISLIYGSSITGGLDEKICAP